MQSDGRPGSLPPLATLLFNLAVTAIDVQRRFDAAHEDALPFGLAVAGLLAPVLGDTAAGLVPTRQRVASFEVCARVRIAITRSDEFTIDAAAFNVAYDLRHATTQTDQSAIRVHVVQIPSADGSAANSVQGETPCRAAI